MKRLLVITELYRLIGQVLVKPSNLETFNMLLLPHHYEFAETLANLPFFYRQMASETSEVMHVIQSTANCLPEIANSNRLREYLFGGEIDETVEFIDGYADIETDNCLQEDNSLLDWELSDEWLGSI